MTKNYAIEFVKQIIVQTFFRNKENDHTLIGGDKEVNLISFFEQVRTQEEVDRYVKRWNELVSQENRSEYIVNGVISTQDNPTITNLYNCLIIPLTWNCVLRCKLKDMDLVVNSVSKLIEKLKGRKQDIAEFEDGKLYMVGTIGNYDDTFIDTYDYIGQVLSTNDLTTQVNTLMTNLESKGFTKRGSGSRTTNYYTIGYGIPTSSGGLAYNKYKIKLIKRQTGIGGGSTIMELDDDPPYRDLPPDSFISEKYKVSMSCDAIRVDTPTTIDGEEYVNVSFSGSATIVNDKVRLGNDLVHIGIVRESVYTDQLIEFNDNYIYLEPLEMPSGNNIANQIGQKASKNFMNQYHNDSIVPTLQYTFVCDRDNELLQNLYKYARYGVFDYTQTWGISPNMVYSIRETYSSWGKVENYDVSAKITEDVLIENNEADVLTIQLTFALQRGGDD